MSIYEPAYTFDGVAWERAAQSHCTISRMSGRMPQSCSDFDATAATSLSNNNRAASRLASTIPSLGMD